MRKRSVLVFTVALITLGSGLVNLSSVIGPPLPERAALLREVFPMEFVHLSHSLTMLIGFALVISSININRRKRRAFRIVLLMAFASVLFHLTKGLDYEEATASLILLIVLVLTRKHFTVKGSIPDWRSEMIRFGIAAVLAFGYGVAGFWFLEPNEFGVNFTIQDSIKNTLSFLSLAGDPTIVPNTHYASWFLDSLYLMTITATGYSGFVLFRPALYHFSTLPRERQIATDILKEHGRSAMDYFKVWPDKAFFFSASQRCFLAYRMGGNFAVVLADPVGQEEEIEATAGGFVEFCQENGWGVGFHQTLPDFLPFYRRLGFRKLKIGDEAIVDLARFSLDGKDMKKFRHKINRHEKEGVHIRCYDPPVPEEVLLQAKAVSDEWLQIPGRRERGFTLGRFEPAYLRSTPMFAAVDRDGDILAFVNIIPSYRKGEATIDLMRHRTEVPNGIMDYLFVKLFCYEKERGAQRFTLGLAPMSGFQEKEEASAEERAVHYFFQRLNFLFSYKGLRQYKAKYASFWEPRYTVYRNVLDLPRMAVALARVSELKAGGTDAEWLAAD